MKTEGRNAVLELLKTDKTVEKILLEKNAQGTLGRIFAEARDKGVRVQFVDRRVLDKESVTGKHQGCIAFSSDYKYSSLQDIMAAKGEKGGFVILCDCIEDVHNLGSIIRVAECAGADGVVIQSTNSASVTEAV
ncbi:MAG: 23S rRNA (guanosine(2251)-2'-O)-methyltransferase RlmB, partial [Clostridia bacterium]|nr:23S rRNA (guanosine(2251)-2'-O)-methyltransferase RlmB [Clostridia bacterium]